MPDPGFDNASHEYPFTGKSGRHRSYERRGGKMRTYSSKMIFLATAATLLSALILGLLAMILMSLHLAEVTISPDVFTPRHISFGLAWGMVAVVMVADILCIRSLLRMRRGGRNRAAGFD
jgi:hypothetical protein